MRKYLGKILTMDSKAFLKHFIYNSDLDFIKKATFIIVSRSIKTSGNYKDRVYVMNSIYPSSENIVMYNNKKKDLKLSKKSKYFNALMEQFDDNSDILCKLLKNTIKSGTDVILLSSYKEDKALNLIDMIRGWFLLRLKYPIYRYEKGDFHQYDMEYDNKEVNKRISKILKENKRAKKKAKKYLREVDLD